MKNSYKLGLASIVASMALVGCGGSSDSSTAVGKAFYIDNAVEGVNYTCGTQKGTTDADGTFTFDIGSGCTFSLGTVFLRDVNVDDLVDGTEMHETNNVISAQLLGMDVDGDPSNGISIDADIVAALEEANITKLPDTDGTDLDIIQTLITDNGGTYVTLTEAQDHLDATMANSITNLLAGKTFYNVGSDNTGDNWIDEVVVNADATSLVGTSLIDSTDTATFDMVIKADTIALSNADEAFELIFIKEAADNLVFQRRDENGTVVEENFMFFDQAAAQAYYDSLQTTEAATDTTTSTGTTTDTGTSTSTAPTITQAMLDGKTFYMYEYNPSYQEEMYSKRTFSAGTLTYTEINNGEGPFEMKLSYEIIEGKIIVDVPAMDGDPAMYMVINLVSEGTDSWTVYDGEDQDRDGTIDIGQEDTWFLSKPVDYPAAL